MLPLVFSAECLANRPHLPLLVARMVQWLGKEVCAVKVAMSVQDEHPQAPVDERFGRCRYFAIADTETGEIVFVPNDAVDDKGAGVKAARILLKQNVDAVIVGNIGPKAFEILNRARIPVYAGLTGTTQESLELFKQGKLSKLAVANN